MKSCNILEGLPLEESIRPQKMAGLMKIFMLRVTERDLLSLSSRLRMGVVASVGSQKLNGRLQSLEAFMLLTMRPSSLT